MGAEKRVSWAVSWDELLLIGLYVRSEQLGFTLRPERTNVTLFTKMRNYEHKVTDVKDLNQISATYIRRPSWSILHSWTRGTPSPWPLGSWSPGDRRRSGWESRWWPGPACRLLCDKVRPAIEEEVKRWGATHEWTQCCCWGVGRGSGCPVTSWVETL